jgi:hypothetical protein
MRVYVGNAVADGAGDDGWLLGHFKPDGDVRHSRDVEIKWGVHAAGVDHSWRAEQESVVMTVRWPSVAGYKVP